MTPLAPPWLAKLRDVQRRPTGWIAFCPGHDDREKRSLSITAMEGRWLVHCFVGCATEQIMAGIGEPLATLFADAARRAGPAVSRIVATYDYTDAMGQLLFQVVRYEPKGFRQRRPDGVGGWIWSLGDVPRVLYRLPDLAEVPRLLWVEGEADVDTLRAHGILATTSMGGASAWRDQYAEDLARLGVLELVILPDHDEPGEQYAAAVAGAARTRGMRVKIVRLPGLAPKGDVSDWLGAGNTVEYLQRIIDETPWSEPELLTLTGRVHLSVVLDAVVADAEAGRHEAITTGLAGLDAMLGGGLEPSTLIYLGGRPGMGKTALALQWAREAARSGSGVLVVSLEMALLALGRRLLASVAEVDSMRLKTGRLGDGDWYAIRASIPKLRELPMWLCASVSDVAAINALVMEHAEQPPLSLVVVDYLQLVQSENAVRDQRARVEAVSQGLKALARQRRIAVLCASALSRAPAQHDRRPTLADLRESGALEHDADVVVFLHAPNVLAPERELILAKSRDGPVGVLNLRFRPEHLRFCEGSQREEDERS